MPGELPVVACTLDDAQLPERRRAWEDLCAQSLTGIERTVTGLRLEFRSGADVERELRRLAALEAQCCSFADWAVRGDGAGAVLEVTAGHREAVAAVQALFRR